MEVATLAVAAQELVPPEPALQELLVPQDLALALAQLASMAQALDHNWPVRLRNNWIVSFLAYTHSPELFAVV